MNIKDSSFLSHDVHSIWYQASQLPSIKAIFRSLHTKIQKLHLAIFGDMDDEIVIRDRATDCSHEFGYATFSLEALYSEHFINSCALEVKVATPKEEIKAPSKKMTRIFVARIHSSVTKDAFRKYVEAYGNIEYLLGESKRLN